MKFFIDYEFKSRTLQMLAGAVFEQVFRKMAEAFEARADDLETRVKPSRFRPSFFRFGAFVTQIA